MSRRKLTARDKKTQKMSRDGLVERNQTSGEDINISKRETDFDIKGDTREHESLSQIGTRLDGRTETANDKPTTNKKTAQRHNDQLREETAAPKNEPPQVLQHETTLLAEKISAEENKIAPDAPKHQAADSSKTSKSREPPDTPDDKGSYTSQHQSELPDHYADIDTSGSDKVLEDKPKKWDSEQLVESLKHRSEKGKSRLGLQHDALPRNQTSGKNRLKTRNNVAYQEQQPASLQHKGDSDTTPLRHQSEKLIFSETMPEQLAAPVQKGGKSKKRRKTKYNPNQSSAIKHEAAVIPISGETRNSDTLYQVGTSSDDKANIRQNSAIRHDKPSVIQHEPQSSDSAPVIQTDKSKLKTQRETVLRHSQAEQKADLQSLASETPLNHKHETAHIEGEQFNKAADVSRDVPLNRPAVTPNNRGIPIIPLTTSGKRNQNRNTVYQHNKPAAVEHEPQKPDSQLTHENKTGTQAETGNNADIPQSSEEITDNWAEQKNPQPLSEDAPINNEAETAENNIPTNPIPKPNDTPNTQIKHDKSGKLKFAEDEAAPEKPTRSKQTRKLEKLEKQTGKAGDKLEKAKNKLPSKRKLRAERVFDEQKGKAKTKLSFEKEVKSQGEHLKGAKPLRPVKTATNALMLNAHRKIYQVEHENVAVKAAHRVEMVGEAGVRTALRHHKLAPYKKVAKLEKAAAKKTIKLNYEKVLAQNPKLKSNALSRMWQKRKIRKQYAKAARDAKRAAGATKKIGSAAIKAAKAAVRVVLKNPKVLIVIIALFLIIVMIMSLFTMCANMGGTGLTAILSSSYLAEDEDMEKAAIAYTEWETDLQYELLNTENAHPGYDEYRYNIGDISHNPFELMAYLTAVYHNFPYDSISSDLQAIFNEQYTLTFTPTTETRYRTVTKYDPDTGDPYDDIEAYDWHIMTVTLTSRSFSDIIMSRMTYDQQAHYAILMQTKGNRQYVGSPFAVGWLPYVTSYYGYRVHPITGAKDLHRGIDIAMPAGTQILSAHDGTVTFAGVSGGYGNVVVIENDNGIVTKYAHCDTILVSVGQGVSMGDPIATVGSTGDSTGAHLHFEILKDGEYLNPLIFADSGSFSLTPVYGTPGTPMGDGSFAALLAEAELYLNYPYRWGGSSPSTSFDCSGYISYILRASGVKDVGRQTAQGLYNLSTPIYSSAAQPGDLVFFHSTYSTTNTVTHVGLYVGVIDGHPTFIHAGDPISYARLDTAYWQSKFYAFGRLD